MQDLKQEFDYDVIILNTKSRMFAYYNPHLEEADGCWFPKDFNNCKIPKIMIEEDYHYEKNDNWYLEVGIDLMLQRHYSGFTKGKEWNNIKTLWFPFSVDTNIFKPNFELDRIKKICLVGSSTYVYIHRRIMEKILKEQDLIVKLDTQLDDKYTKCLQSYVSHLNCSSIYHISPAKMFEIMASGSILFTNDALDYGLQYLFKKNSYCTYKEDGSDVISKAQMIINDKEYRKEVINNALKCIKEKHTNEIRTRELLSIIHGEFKI